MRKVTRNLVGTCWYNRLNGYLISVISRSRYASTLQWYLCACTAMQDGDEPDPTETYYQYLTQKELESCEELEGME